MASCSPVPRPASDLTLPVWTISVSWGEGRSPARGPRLSAASAAHCPVRLQRHWRARPRALAWLLAPSSLSSNIPPLGSFSSPPGDFSCRSSRPVFLSLLRIVHARQRHWCVRGPFLTPGPSTHTAGARAALAEGTNEEGIPVSASPGQSPTVAEGQQESAHSGPGAQIWGSRPPQSGLMQTPGLQAIVPGADEDNQFIIIVCFYF